jgi:transcriptional regulator with XRE-family HTH domain
MDQTVIDIGPKVKEYRLERGWSQRQLGERAGLSGQLIWLIERGTANPSLESVAKIAGALGVSPVALIE